MSTFFRQTAQAMIAKHIDRDLRKKALPSTAENLCLGFGCRGRDFLFISRLRETVVWYGLFIYHLETG